MSGQHLAELIGCSRTAVWKHIEELRKEGFELEAVRRKGYRIVKDQRKLWQMKCGLGLKTERLGQHIHYEESRLNTKDGTSLKLRWAPEGTVVIAEEQTAGRGRMERPWHSPKLYWCMDEYHFTS